MKRKIPYGIMNWAEVVRECHFVDSTAYIRVLEDVKTPVFLRPKRFGKSLWCSMLGYYYDVNCKDRFDELGIVGFSESQVAKYVDEIYADQGFDWANLPAVLVEFKYFTGAEADRRHLLGRAEPDAETAAQAARYRASLFWRPGWNHPVEAAVVEVCGSRGYNWFDIP